MFNPIKYQYLARLTPEGEVNLKLGAKEFSIKLPLEILPPEVEVGQNFVLKILPQDSAKESDQETMRKLLQELIN